MYDNRELLFLLAQRDLKVRYAQTYVGIAWALFNPIINLLILTFVFNRVAKVNTLGVPALVYAAAGLLAWTFFAEATAKSGESLLGNQHMVRKIYFPRLALPLSSVLSSIPDLLISFLLFVLVSIAYGYLDMSQLHGLLLLLPLLFIAAITTGLWISGLTIRFRDFRFIVPVILRVGLFSVPIAYPYSSIPTEWQWAYFLNPLAGLVAGAKWSLLGLSDFPTQAWIGLPVLLLLFVFGLYLFNRVERFAADHL